MISFFFFAARSQTAHLGDLSKWDVSNVNNMCRTFGDIASNATSLYFTGIEKWDVSNVTDMNLMFYHAASRTVDLSVDLSGCDVRNVTEHNEFNYNVEAKVIAPNWIQ